jgi:hypothetical protein
MSGRRRIISHHITGVFNTNKVNGARMRTKMLEGECNIFFRDNKKSISNDITNPNPCPSLPLPSLRHPKQSTARYLTRSYGSANIKDPPETK